MSLMTTISKLLKQCGAVSVEAVPETLRHLHVDGGMRRGEAGRIR